MSAGPLVVTYPLTGRSRAIVAEELGGTAEAIYLADLAPADRAHALGRAGAVLSHDTSKELRPDEILLIRNARLLQFTAAGVDWVPTRDLPRELPVAANKGGGAEPMSEHIVALALAAAKRLFIEHAKLKHGEFNQRSANRMLRGGVCGILGFGNVGVATARLMRAFGMKIHAINRRGASNEPTDWIATADLLDEMLRVADVLVISAALTTATEGLIGARELDLMKESAILINVARGEIIDEGALYAHLVAHPHFFAGIDAWWVEPVRHGRFAMGHPFLDLPNVIGSPRLTLIVQHVADHHLRTLCYQQAGLRGTLAARPAAHEHHLVIEACHVRSPRLSMRRVWQIGRPGCHFEGAARQIIFKMTAMRRGDFPPMCDNARQGARHRRSVEPALILWEASTPDERHQRLHQVR